MCIFNQNDMRTFIFFLLCYFSKHVLIQVQPDRYTSILKKGFNVKQMIDYSVEQILFIIFFNTFHLLFCNLLTVLFYNGCDVDR